MTNKEAIEFLKNMIDRESVGFVCPQGDGDVAIWEYHVAALNMAIKALEEPHWIPVTERLPEDDTLMLVNYIDHRPDAGDIWIGWHEMENVWYIDGEEHSEERGNEVVAWMPLPEPYQKGETE